MNPELVVTLHRLLTAAFVIVSARLFRRLVG